MNNFKTQLLGYSKKQVEEYFAGLEDQHKNALSQKELELSKINEKIKQITMENNNLTQELDALTKKKIEFINHMNDRIGKIEKFVNNKLTESEKAKKAALEELISKRYELTKAQSCIKEFKKDLTYIKNRRILAGELFNR